MDLYVSTAPELEKLAAKPTRLGENEDTWPNEILAALYKSHPFLGSYKVGIHIDGQDTNIGYMYGHIEVSNSFGTKVLPDSSMSGQVNKVQDPTQPVIRIPILVEKGQLKPIDTMIDPDERFWPISESRVNAALFTPQQYQSQPKSEASTPGVARSMQTINNTPQRGRSGGFMGKFSSVIAATPKSTRVNFVKEAMAKDWVKLSARNNKELVSSLSRLSSIESDAEPEDAGEVIVLEKVAGGYKVHLYRDDLSSTSYTITNAQASRLPQDVKKEAVAKGVALIPFSRTDNSPAEVGVSGMSSSPGVYEVFSKSAGLTQAAVLPRVRNFDGTHSNLVPVVTASGVSLQEKVAGTKLKDLSTDELTGHEIDGHGFFVFASGECSEPVEIHTKVSSPLGLQQVTVSSEEAGVVDLVMDDVVRVPVKLAEARYLFPRSAKFIRAKYDSLGVHEGSELFKSASVGFAPAENITVSGGSGGYSFSGDRVPSNAQFLGRRDALALMGAFGVGGKTAAALLDASMDRDVEFARSKDLVAPETKTAAPALRRLDLDGAKLDLLAEACLISSSLVKTAASIVDEDTIDSVLSLNFLTPENVQAYVDKIDDYEQALSNLSELLIATRIGISQIPEAALSSCIKTLSKVIDALNSMQAQSPGQ